MRRLDKYRKIRSLENPSTPLSNPDDWTWDALGGTTTTAGVRITRNAALGLSAYWRGVSLLARDVAKLPLGVYRNSKNGILRDPKHPAHRLLSREPNEMMTAFTWRQTAMVHVLTNGNSYTYVERRIGDESPTALLLLNPDRTWPIRANEKLWYIHEYEFDGQQHTVKLEASDVIHIKGLSFDGMIGYSLYEIAKETLGLGIAARGHGASYFANSTRPDVILKHPQRLNDRTRQSLRESWERMHQGVHKHHRTAILEDGMTIDTLGSNADDAQLIEVFDQVGVDIANFIGIPPHKLGLKVNASYSSLEQSAQDYLDDALDPWLCNWEQETERDLLTEDQKLRESHCVRFNRLELARTNISVRQGFASTMVAGGIINRDEARAILGFNPIPDGSGQNFMIPLNQGPPPSPDPDPEPTPPDAEPPDPEQNSLLPKLQSSLQKIITATTQRMIRRVGTHAERAAKKPGQFLNWLDTIKVEHRSVAIEALTDSLQALSLAEGRTYEATDYVDKLLDTLRRELLEASGRASSAQLPTEVERVITTLETYSWLS